MNTVNIIGKKLKIIRAIFLEVLYTGTYSLLDAVSTGSFLEWIVLHNNAQTGKKINGKIMLTTNNSGVLPEQFGKMLIQPPPDEQRLLKPMKSINAEVKSAIENDAIKAL